MSQDNRAILEALKAELNFLEQGGYGRSVRTPRKATSIFESSPTCLNFGDPERPHPCKECLLWQLVPRMRRSLNVPCHHIPLNEAGDTVESLERSGNQQKLEKTVGAWLRAAISLLEEEGRRRMLGLKPKSVLIVDHDEDTLIALEALLEDAGLNTPTTWGYREALAILRQELSISSWWTRIFPSRSR